MKCLSLLGLALDVVGAVLLAWPIFRLRDRDAVETARPRLPLGPTDDDVRRLPTYIDLMRQGRFARWGMVLLIAGFLLQFAGTLMQK